MFWKQVATKETVLPTMPSLQSRYERLYYPGPLFDGTPLPINPLCMLIHCHLKVTKEREKYSSV